MNKVVIITGAASGIGFAAAEMLVKKGFTVFGVDKNRFDAGSFKCFCADINDASAMSEIFAEIYNECGRIDALVNNAGFGISGAVEDADIKNIKSIAETNFVSLAVCCKLVIPYLKKSKGRIVNVGSIGGCIPLPFQAMYSATKSAVEVFSRALNGEVRPFGVRVTCVMPGDTKTGFTEARIKEGEDFGDNAERSRRSVGKMEHDEKNGMSPNKVAKTIFKVLTAKRRISRVSVGASSKFIVFLSKVLPVKTVDFIVRRLYAS